MAVGRLRALVAALGLWGVIAAGCSRESSAPTQPSPPPTPPAHYTAVGASDAVGIGASVVCPLFGACPSGTGYVPVIARRLGATQTVTTTNLGIPGAVLSPEIQELGNRHGRGIPANFLQHELPLVPSSTTLVTIFAGGNDTNAIGTAVERGAAGSSGAAAFIDAQIAQFRASLGALVAGLRQRAPGVRIVIANLPNLAGLPYAQGLSLQQRQWLQHTAVGISREAVNVLAAQGIPVVDLLCDARAYDPGSYSGDGFHPNDRGYAFMADVFLAAIQSPSPPAPAAACAPMVVVPPL